MKAKGDFLITLNGRVGVSVRLLGVAKNVVRVGLAAALLSSMSIADAVDPARCVIPIIEALVALMLLIAWQLRPVALLSAAILVLRAIAIFFSLGVAAPPAYFALTAASAAFLLFAVLPSKTYETT